MLLLLRMKLDKLFRLLVVGGAVMAGAQACGPVDEGPQQQQQAATQPDGGAQQPSTGGGGVDFW